MTGIVLQTNAIKVDNRGGGYPTKMFREQVEEGLSKKKRVFTRRMQSPRKIPGTDYVVFECPAPDCGRRNRKSVYEAKASTGDGRLSFRCSGCYREIEVQRPMSQLLKIESETKQEAALQVRPGVILGPNGKPIRAQK